MPTASFKPTQSPHQNLAYWHTRHAAALESGDLDLAADLDLMAVVWEEEVMLQEQDLRFRLELMQEVA